MAAITLSDPSGTRVSLLLKVTPAMLSFLAHKGFVILSSRPVA